VADLALTAELVERADLVLEGEGLVDPVQLVEVDALHVEPPQAHLDALAQVGGVAEGDPLARTGADEPALGRDGHPAVGVAAVAGVQRLADELLGDERAVAVGGVDQVHAQLDGPAQDRQGRVAVPGLAPHPLAGDAHGAEPEPGDVALTPQGERSGRGGGGVGHGGSSVGGARRTVERRLRTTHPSPSRPGDRPCVTRCS
jgi:hypothetical protein